MKVITQQLTGTTAEWENANPRLYEGVWGFEITTDNRRLLKIGKAEGNSGLAMYWNDLPYVDETSIFGLPEHLGQIVTAAEGNLAAAAALLQAGIDTETEARIAGDEALQANIDTETAARITGDEALQTGIDEVAVKADENHHAFNYLLQFIIAKLGPLDTIAMTTESGDTLVTEAGIRLIA
jgi:hypothetical protein